MTFSIKVRGAIGSPIKAEYRCPVHGVFEAEVRRDVNGDPPDMQSCPAWMDCPCGESGTNCFYERCDLPSPWTLTSPPAGTVRMVEAVRGKSDPAPTPTACDTRLLGEGMPLNEWKERRAKMWNDVDFRAHKEGK